MDSLLPGLIAVYNIRPAVILACVTLAIIATGFGLGLMKNETANKVGIYLGLSALLPIPFLVYYLLPNLIQTKKFMSKESKFFGSLNSIADVLGREIIYSPNACSKEWIISSAEALLRNMAEKIKNTELKERKICVRREQDGDFEAMLENTARLSKLRQDFKYLYDLFESFGLISGGYGKYFSGNTP